MYAFKLLVPLFLALDALAAIPFGAIAGILMILCLAGYDGHDPFWNVTALVTNAAVAMIVGNLVGGVVPQELYGAGLLIACRVFCGLKYPAAYVVAATLLAHKLVGLDEKGFVFDMVMTLCVIFVPNYAIIALGQGLLDLVHVVGSCGRLSQSLFRRGLANAGRIPTAFRQRLARGWRKRKMVDACTQTDPEPHLVEASTQTDAPSSQMVNAGVQAGSPTSSPKPIPPPPTTSWVCRPAKPRETYLRRGLKATPTQVLEGPRGSSQRSSRAFLRELWAAKKPPVPEKESLAEQHAKESAEKTDEEPAAEKSAEVPSVVEPPEVSPIVEPSEVSPVVEPSKQTAEQTSEQLAEQTPEAIAEASALAEVSPDPTGERPSPVAEDLRASDEHSEVADERPSPVTESLPTPLEESPDSEDLSISESFIASAEDFLARGESPLPTEEAVASVEELFAPADEAVVPVEETLGEAPILAEEDTDLAEECLGRSTRLPAEESSVVLGNEPTHRDTTPSSPLNEPPTLEVESSAFAESLAQAIVHTQEGPASVESQFPEPSPVWEEISVPAKEEPISTDSLFGEASLAYEGDLLPEVGDSNMEDLTMGYPVEEGPALAEHLPAAELIWAQQPISEPANVEQGLLSVGFPIGQQQQSISFENFSFAPSLPISIPTMRDVNMEDAPPTFSTAFLTLGASSTDVEMAGSSSLPPAPEPSLTNPSVELPSLVVSSLPPIPEASLLSSGSLTFPPAIPATPAAGMMDLSSDPPSLPSSPIAEMPDVQFTAPVVPATPAVGMMMDLPSDFSSLPPTPSPKVAEMSFAPSVKPAAPVTPAPFEKKGSPTSSPSMAPTDSPSPSSDLKAPAFEDIPEGWLIPCTPPVKPKPLSLLPPRSEETPLKGKEKASEVAGERGVAQGIATKGTGPGGQAAARDQRPKRLLMKKKEVNPFISRAKPKKKPDAG
ncbi:hypothetical protein F4804DRAFT_332913 [Jackrogersella minutella]|nr:hypothetical protein F4804DRAFT_332913 [Jackrogersella minutella]